MEEQNKYEQMNALNFAFLGDAIFTQFVRNKLVEKFDSNIDKLNKKSSHIVSAVNQAIIFDELLPILTEEEHSITQRARNTKKHSVAKNCSLEEYSKSTQFEALLGYLFLTKQTDRLNEILNRTVIE